MFGANQTPLLRGYSECEELVRDECYVTLRARRDADDRRVLLRCIASQAALPLVLAGLKREGEVLAELAGEGVPDVLASETQCLLLADDGLVPLSRLTRGLPLPLPTFFRIARGLLRVIGRVHRSGFVHRRLHLNAVLATESGAVQLFDFSAASRLAELLVTPRLRSPSSAREILSPEQTGRIQRVVDFRTDFYALGAVFYQLLTGRAPFESPDPLELAHFHIARVPTPPAAVLPQLPEALSKIVQKLLAKMAEDRYQSAEGIRCDLDECERRLGCGDTRAFTLGEAEVAPRLSLPQRLFGRDEEKRKLLAAFERACAGHASFVFLSGAAGVGKTALANELESVVCERGGRFLIGKFDVIERSRPYSALAKGLSQLFEQLEELPSARRAVLMQGLAESLGSNARALGVLVPRLADWLPNCPELPPLGPIEAQNRLALAVEKLLAQLARPEAPLVIVLDDLQWADLATLRLIGSLFSNAAPLPILWLGAFRDNEVAVEHPVARLRQELRACADAISDLTLAPLGADALGALLAETLHRPAHELDALARLVLDKTLGNPFFVLQFVRSLERERLLSFDRERQAWVFDRERAEALDMTDNVLELMAKKLGYLSPAARHALQAAACVGAVFSLMSLAELLTLPATAAAKELWEALVEGLLLPLDPNYELLLAADQLDATRIEFRFLHDRVQQAAYASLDDAERARFHLSLGRSLGQRADAAERLFEIVGHLNRAKHLISQDPERRKLAELNLAAGQRARAAAAIPSALNWFVTGLELCASARDELFFRLSLSAAECEFIVADADSAEARLAGLLDGDASLELKIEALCIRIVRHENVGRFAESVQVGVAALELLGFGLASSSDERAAALQHELAQIQALLGARGAEHLLALERTRDTQIELAARVSMAMWPSAFLSNQDGLTALLSARVVRLSLERGNTLDSALAYVTHAITRNASTHSSSSGRAYAEVGLQLAAQYAHLPLTVRVEHLYGSFLSALYEPLAQGAVHAERAHRAALESGDFTYAARALFMGSWYWFFGGVPLDEFETRSRGVLDFLRRVRHPMIERAESVLLQWARALRGSTQAPMSLADESFDEHEAAQTFAKVPIFGGFLAVAHAFLCFTFGDLRAADEHARRAHALLSGSAETLWHFQLEFVQALIHAGLCAGAEAETATRLERLDEALSRIRGRAESCAQNFRYQADLLAAERARLLGAPADAEALYQSALSACAPDDAAARALCHELFGRFALLQNDVSGAKRELSLALGDYRAWRAEAKALQLGREHAALLDEAAFATSDFDALSTLKAAQAIAAEIARDRLLPRLIDILVENAGAERGLLLEPSADSFVLVAEGRVGHSGVYHREPRQVSGAELPLELLTRVQRSLTPLLVSNASDDARLRSDAYVRAHASRSMLCVPIVAQGAARAVVFLENALACEVFPPERIQVVQLLAAQAAISLENARLYESMRTEIARRAQAEAALETALRDLDALKNRLQAENVYLQEELLTHHNFEEIVGKAPELLAALRLVERVASTDSTVLVCGETGTGKELFARAIHSRSGRSGRPLVKVNCGAIAVGLVESELFGHVKGAFTGALHKRVGRFELADGGTIFLDEVGELPLETQAKLLRVLQEREFEAVGSSTTQRVDVRVIAATNRDLDEAVRCGRFRADLLYRLNVFPIQVPPLRQRSEDIPLLVSFFLTRLSSRLGKRLQGFSRDDMRALREYPWPGNVRELQNVIERAAILARGTQLTLDAQFVSTQPPINPARRDVNAPVLPAPRATAATPVSGVRSIEEVERQHILEVLDSTSWIVEGERGAAKILGLHPNTLRSRMKKLGISRREHSGAGTR